MDLEYKLPRLEIQVGKKSVQLHPQMIDFKEEQREVAMDGEADSVYFSLQSHDGPWKVRDTFSSILSEGLEPV
jgi:hypothetical protein